VRRDELAALGVQLPVLPTIVLGALPPRPDWPGRLARLGLDVVATGVREDTPDTLAAARAAAPHLAVKVRTRDARAFDGHRGVIVETAAEVPPGLYRLGPDESALPAVDGTDPEVEDPREVARAVLLAARAGVPSAMWVAVTPGLDGLPVATAELKLEVLVQGARQARLYLAKEQFEI
jgi:hypothetical protein